MDPLLFLQAEIHFLKSCSAGWLTLFSSPGITGCRLLGQLLQTPAGDMFCGFAKDLRNLAAVGRYSCCGAAQQKDPPHSLTDT